MPFIRVMYIYISIYIYVCMYVYIYSCVYIYIMSKAVLQRLRVL